MNVIAALLSSGRFMPTKLWQSVNGLWFLGFLMALTERIRKPLVVILDNASIHTANKLKPYWDLSMPIWDWHVILFPKQNIAQRQRIRRNAFSYRH